MFIKFKDGKLKILIQEAIGKVGNIRNLESKIEIPRSTLSAYLNEQRLIKKENLDKILFFINKKLNKGDVSSTLSSNWRQKKGGKKSVKIRMKNGTYLKQLRKCHKSSSKYMKKWHKKMKKKYPKKYYLSQYEKFKKISEYKFLTDNKERVRNKLEKDVADILKKMKIKYKYEPYIRVNNKCFFPDFLIKNKIIIECTMWRGQDKAIKLKEKIKNMKGKYKVYVVIPKALNNYYLTLNKHLILGLDDFVPVAQTFRDLKS